MELRIENFSVPSSSREGCPLFGCSLTARPGELVGIAGPSGCGKSTLLKYAVRVLKSNLATGVCEWRFTNDGSLVNQRDLRNFVKFVPARDFLPPELSVQECISGQLAMRTGNVSREAVQQVARLFGLHNILTRKIGGLTSSGISTGQRRRLALALEYLDQPKAILIDEPTSGIDSKAAVTIVRLLRGLARNAGATVVCVLHQPAMSLFSLLDKVAVMSAGHILYWGSGQECLTFFSPDRYVALQRYVPFTLQGPSPGSRPQGWSPASVELAGQHPEGDTNRSYSRRWSTKSLYDAAISLSPLELVFCFALKMQDIISQNAGMDRNIAALLKGNVATSDSEEEPRQPVPASLPISAAEDLKRARSLGFIDANETDSAETELRDAVPDLGELRPSSTAPVLLSDLDIRPQKSTTGTFKQNWFQQFWFLFLRHLYTRFRERGFIVGSLIIFALMTLVVACVYHNLPEESKRSDIVPLEPRLPALDAMFPDYPNGAEWQGRTGSGERAASADWPERRLWPANEQRIGEDEATDIATVSQQLPEGWKEMIQELLSAPLFGLDGHGEGLGYDVIMGGIDGNGSLPSIPQFLISALPTLIPCMHHSLKLETKYPSYRVRPHEAGGGSTEGDTTEATEEASTESDPAYFVPKDAYDLVEQAVQLYQLIDEIVMNYDWWEFISCFQENVTPLARWLCVLTLYPQVYNSALGCMGFPPVPVFLFGLLEFQQQNSLVGAADGDTAGTMVGEELADAGSLSSLLTDWLTSLHDAENRISPAALLLLTRLRGFLAAYPAAEVTEAVHRYNLPQLSEVFKGDFLTKAISWPDLQSETSKSYGKTALNQDQTKTTFSRSHPGLPRSPTGQLQKHYELQSSNISHVSFREILSNDWDKFVQQMPMQRSVPYLIAAIIWPQNMVEAAEKFTRISSDLLDIIDKFTINCHIPLCRLVAVLPGTAADLFSDLVHVFWAAFNKCGLIFVVSASTACWGLECALEFPKEREIANKDILNHTYTRVHFAIVKLIVDGLVQVIPVVLYGTIVLLVSGVYTSAAGFFRLLLALVLTCLSAAGMASFFSAVARSKAIALALSTVALTACLLLSGFLLRTAWHATWHKVFSSLSMFHWGYAAMMIETIPPNSTGFLTRWFVLEFLGGVPEDENGWSYRSAIVALIVQCVAYRMLALIAMLTLHKKLGLKNS